MWWRRRRNDEDFHEEINAHVALETDRLIAEGSSPQDARVAAQRAFGNVAAAREQFYDSRRIVWFDQARQDIQYTFRTFRRHPGFVAVAVITLALGIGANAAIFSVVYPVLLKPLPYGRSEELVTVSTYMPQLRSKFPSLPVRAIDFEAFRRSNRVFTGMSAVVPADFTLTGVREPERLYGARVSASLFSLLGVQPAQGRTFLPEEDTEGRDHVVILSHEVWARQFGSDPGVLNRPLSLNGQGYVVVGIMPPGFLFPTGKQLHSLVPLGPRVDVWKPMAFTRSELTSEGSWNWGVVARLKPTTTMTQAQEDMNTIANGIVKRVLTQIPGSGFDVRVQLRPVREMFSGNVRQALLFLTGAVGLLLMIACVNVTNLLLARISSREREFATRKALGASRSRLARQQLVESVTVAAMGGAAGLLVASWGAPVLVSLGPPDLLALHAGRLSGPVFLFTLVAALATAVAFGLVPSLEAARGDLYEPLKGGGHATTSGLRGGRLRRVLVAVEVALCTGLLAVAGLLLHSLVNVMNTDKGFAVENILTANIVLSGRQYSTPRAVAFYHDMVERIRTLPGVTAAGAVSALPLMRESDTTQIYLESDTQYRLIERPVAAYRNVTTGYFATMAIPLLAGRFLDDRESVRAAVVSASLAQRLWPDAPHSGVPGRRVRQGDISSPLVTVVGVVGDICTTALDRDAFPVIYRPHAQAPSGEMTVVARTAQPPATLTSAIRAEMWTLDKDLPAPTVKTMAEIVSASVAQRRFQTMLVVLFGVVALALAAVGIYGVINYSVARQTQEIGVRMALGGRRSAILRSVLLRGMQPAVVGLAVGLAGARIAAMTVRSVLFRVEPLDPVALGGVCAVMLLTATVASYVPARRATLVDPLIALRTE
jgi:putative ABC transport system permease protein